MTRVGDVLSLIISNDMLEQAENYSAMIACWKDLTEKNRIPYAADHSWVKSLERGLVWIEVDHPGWKQILQTKERKLLSDFRRRFPDMDISGIAIVLCRPGTRPEPEPIVEEPKQYPLPQEAEPMFAAEGYAAIKEGPLKDALMRLERSVAAREAEL